MNETATPPLPADPEVTILRPPNGLTCWIRPHRPSPGGVALGLQVAVGSLHEEDGECGVSHMLEHLAFEGGVHIPPGGLRRFFESMGTRIGRHHNGFTGREWTRYTLSLPESGEEVLDRGLACMADCAYGMSFRPAAVEAERRIIIEEMRRRQDATTRVRDQILELLLPGSLLPRRPPLGYEDVVRSLTLSQLRAYYDRWYRPGNSILVVAGEVDPAVVERLVHRYFTAWPAAPTPPPPDPGLRPLVASRAAIITDPELRRAEIRLVGLRPSARARTVGELRTYAVGEMAVRILNQRLDALIRAGRAPFHEARLAPAPLVHDRDVVWAVASGLPGRTQAMLSALAAEPKRARVHGFAGAEVEGAVAHLRLRARRAARHAATASADLLLVEMLDAVPDGRPPPSQAQRLAVLETFLPEIVPDELRTAFAANFDANRRLVAAVLPEGHGLRLSEEELLRLHARTEIEPVTPPAVRTAPPHLPKPLLQPGMVATQCEDPELGVLSATLSNGVRVHLRCMDSEKQRVWAHFTLAGGRIRERSDQLGITGAAALAFSGLACRRVPSVRIRDLLSDHGLFFACSVDEDAVVLRLGTDPCDLELGLRVVCLLLAEARLEAGALERWQGSREELGPRTLEERMAEETLRLLTGDDPRFRPISPRQARAISLGAARQWLRRELCLAPLEVAIAGDLDRDRGLELARHYLGSLPERPLRALGLDDLRRLGPERGPLESTVTAATTTPRAAVLTGWRAAPWRAVDDRRLLGMAVQILSQRLYREVRGHRGLTYHGDCSCSPSRAYPQASLLSVAFYTPAERVAEAVAVTRELVGELAADGPTEGEMEAARKHFSELASRAQGDPKYWSRVLADCDYRGLRRADLKRLPERFLAVVRQDLQAALGRYVGEDRQLTVTCLPATDPYGPA